MSERSTCVAPRHAAAIPADAYKCGSEKVDKEREKMKRDKENANKVRPPTKRSAKSRMEEYRKFK